MDFTQRPYKPTIYPSGCSRGRGRGSGRSQGRKPQGGFQSSYQPHRGQGHGGFRGKPRGGKYDKMPLPRGFLEKTPRQKMETKTNAGIAMKLAIG